MWLFYRGGFISAVQDRDEEQTIIVRARERSHLEPFIESEDDIVELADADYRFRVFIDRPAFSEVVSELIQTLNYPNFKSASFNETSAEWSSVLHRVWALLLSYQERLIRE